MKKPMAILGILISASCTGAQSVAPGLEPCSEPWQEFVEMQLHTGDDAGHGPDLGSLEWRSVVEFKLGIRGDPAIPSRESDAWCAYIDKRILQSASQ